VADVAREDEAEHRDGVLGGFQSGVRPEFVSAPPHRRFWSSAAPAGILFAAACGHEGNAADARTNQQRGEVLERQWLGGRPRWLAEVPGSVPRISLSEWILRVRRRVRRLVRS